jgi:thioredoxin-dependent peroxiredoxin
MLAIGSHAPEIDAQGSAGRFVLSAEAGRLCTVVYFFPKAFTPGCTRETARFRDNYMELRLAGAAVVGVSTDAHDTQCRFAQSMDAQFPIVADTDGAIARAYDVRWPIVGLAQRVTYIVSPERIVVAAFHHEIQATQHVDDVLRFVDGLVRARVPG